MEKISTIQKRNKLNEVYREDEPGAGGACHCYLVCKAGDDGTVRDCGIVGEIQFQHGARYDATSVHGVLDTDLLEIVRDRLKSFQSGEFSTRENTMALTHIEEALLWLNKRVEDRAERGVLGTMKK